MSDFVELGLEAADHLLDNHFDKIPNEVFKPREALHNIRHRHQKHPALDRIEGRPPPSPSQSPNRSSPTSPSSPTQHRKSSRKDSEDKDSEGGYEGDEERPIGSGRGDRSRSHRRRERQDPYYHEAEKRTQNPRDYDPECLDKNPSSPKNPYWAQQQSPHPLTAIPTRLSSSSLYVSHPADPSYSTQQRLQISDPTGPSSTYVQANTSRRRSVPAPTAGSALSPGSNDPYYRRRHRSPPPNSPVIRGAPTPRYDARSPNPPPNVDPYYPAQQQRSPSPTLPPPQPSISYAAAAYTPYPYPSPAAAAAAFGAERPYEYEYDPYHPPREEPSRSRSRSRSRHRSSHRRRHRHRHRHRTDRPGMTRRASSTGDTHNDLDRSRSTHRSLQPQTRPGPRRRASSTGALSPSRSPSAAGRKRDFGLPSKLSGTNKALGAGGAGALAGGFLAQEVGSLLRKGGSKGGGNPMVLTLLGAVVGGLGANLMVGKEERKIEGERGSVRGWMEDVRGERRSGVMGWKADEGKERSRSRDGERERRGNR